MRTRNYFELARQVLRGYWQFRRCKVGRLPRATGKAYIHCLGDIVIGDKFNINNRITPGEMVAYKGGRIEIGNNVFINHGASISAHKLVKIGDGCQLGPSAYLLDNDYHSLGNLTELSESQPITLGKNVWLAVRVVVLKGVTIGDNSVIGAGSVVTKDIPPNVLAAGVPAKVIKEIEPSKD